MTDLSTAYGSDYTIAGGTTATIFFQFREVSATGGSYDVMMGLAENVSDIDNSNSWQDFEVMPYLAGGGPGVADLNSTGGTAIVDPAADAWYNVWLVVNNTAKTYDIYTSTGTANGTLQVTGATFVGSGATTGDLKAFALSNGQDGHLQIDNLAIDLSGSNTTFIPEPSISLLGGLGLLGLLRRRRA